MVIILLRLPSWVVTSTTGPGSSSVKTLLSFMVRMTDLSSSRPSPRRRPSDTDLRLQWRRPGVFGLGFEHCVRFRVLEHPVAASDLRLELARRPARMSQEDPQVLHGLLASEQSEQQVPVPPQVHVVENPDRTRRRLRRAKQEPDGSELDGDPRNTSCPRSSRVASGPETASPRSSAWAD